MARTLLGLLLCFAALHDTRMNQKPQAAYVAPEPDAEIDTECPNCGETWHLRFYRDMPLKAIYSLSDSQTWPMLMNHLRRCEKSIGRMLTA
jgi:hypothetical protein